MTGHVREDYLLEESWEHSLHILPLGHALGLAFCRWHIFGRCPELQRGGRVSELSVNWKEHELGPNEAHLHILDIIFCKVLQNLITRQPEVTIKSTQRLSNQGKRTKGEDIGNLPGDPLDDIQWVGESVDQVKALKASSPEEAGCGRKALLSPESTKGEELLLSCRPCACGWEWVCNALVETAVVLDQVIWERGLSFPIPLLLGMQEINHCCIPQWPVEVGVQLLCSENNQA